DALICAVYSWSIFCAACAHAAGACDNAPVATNTRLHRRTSPVERDILTPVRGEGGEKNTGRPSNRHDRRRVRAETSILRRSTWLREATLFPTLFPGHGRLMHIEVPLCHGVYNRRARLSLTL